MNEQKLIYEVQNLSFSYGEHQVLQEMSFSLQKGKITTLIGANGCGKSTLFQLLTRNLKPDQGEICLYGENLRNMKPSGLKAVWGTKAAGVDCDGTRTGYRASAFR